jgi:hypothetical protein
MNKVHLALENTPEREPARNLKISRPSQETLKQVATGRTDQSSCPDMTLNPKGKGRCQ